VYFSFYKLLVAKMYFLRHRRCSIENLIQSHIPQVSKSCLQGTVKLKNIREVTMKTL